MISAKLKEAAGNSADATLYVDDVFSVYLYTGNGSTQTITNGIDLAGKGGLVWIKSRSAATDHKLTDTVRGATKALISNTTGAETTDTTGLTAFSSTGFSLGASSVYNTNAATYASWTFRKAAKFFDVVTWTGTGSARTIAHSLGVAPGMIIVKRTNAIDGWQIYHQSLGNSQAIRFSTAAAVSVGATYWQTTTPTSTEFYIGTDSSVNGSGSTYVAYLYAHDTSSTGIIQCGSYTGNGSATGPVVTLGWEPQYLMVKNASGTGNWQLLDSMRGMPVGSADATLQANLANAESSVNYVSPTATGFQITSTSTEVNTSGSTYIYMAIRMPNKPPTTGTQVFNPTLLYQYDINGSISSSNGVHGYLGYVSDFYIQLYRSGSASNAIARNRLTSSNYLVTSAASAEVTGTVNFWDNNKASGFVTANSVNTTISTLNFRRAPGFFDVVCYTGNGATQNISHNLTVVPELIIVKKRSGTARRWAVQPLSVGTRLLVLNATDAQATDAGPWANTNPTSSVFTVGGDADTNPSGDTLVAYLFATLAGISKVGSYTGNGTGQAIACGFGSGGARFVLIKRTDSTGSWYTFDSARGLTSGSSPYLLLNSTAAETTGDNGVYASSGGFTLGATAITTTNIAAATYIFLAIA